MQDEWSLALRLKKITSYQMSQLSTVAENMRHSNRIGDYTETWWLRSFDARLRRRLRPRRKHRVGETVTSSADQLGNRVWMRVGGGGTLLPSSPSL